MTPSHRRLAALAGSAALLTVSLTPVWSGAAQAADGTATAAVTDDGDALGLFQYTGGPGKNDADISMAIATDWESVVFLVDDVVEIEAGYNCVHPTTDDLTQVACVIDYEEAAGSPQGRIELGEGDDTLRFTNLTTRYSPVVDLGAGDDTYVTTRTDTFDAYLMAGDGDDTLTVGKESQAWGGSGDDEITVIGRALAVYGDDGNDLINGGPDDDQLWGNAGDDIIYGNDGDDNITGGTGNDQLYGGRHNDNIQGNSGNDVIYGNSGDDYISGGPGDDTISGGTGTNTIKD
ncbi:hypothetical protein KIH74_33755 [Kineosporia sp. J2-2]|uniref:Calcium-binding protein n=1 Tax=Kineosporia corallincola TaxID=2835133 RepID=A0ABS5TT08_9ACTN|nr:calcium-binding protein [Kineosporia corallincola]MBT0773959.1 hypothetical protein [Kineosporia corallincola]